MEHLLYAGVLLCVAGLFAFLFFRQRIALAAVARERDEIEVEEHRMFNFLHGLGESLQDDSSPPNMHRYIVEGVTEVVDADGGILYLLDNKRPELVPVFLTEVAAPLVPLPEEVVNLEGPVQEKRLRSFLRLTTVPNGAGFLGRTLANRETVHAGQVLEHEYFEGQPNSLQSGLAALSAPLIYGQKEVGVLAVVKSGGTGFSENDRDVFESVAEQSSFALGSAIIHAEAHDKRRLEDEIRQASEIQRVLLPKKPPGLSDYLVAATYRAARLVSGDYFDYVPVDEDRYGVAIGDVCGKGIAASLIMAMCRSTLRNNASNNPSPASVLEAVNRSIFPDIREDMFVSLLYLVLERGSNKIKMARAGHEPPLLFRQADGAIEEIEPPGIAAGIDDGEVFERVLEDHTIEMETADVLLLYTDGVNERMRQDGEEFGLDRLKAALEESARAGADAVIDTVSQTLAEFGGENPQNDDITLIAIEKH